MATPQSGDTGVVIIPPQSIVSLVNSWRANIDHQATNISAHVTVVYPFIPVDKWPQAAPRVLDCVREFHKFDIVFRHLSYFLVPQYVLWLKPDHNPELMTIHKILHHKFNFLLKSSRYSYCPHLTVGLYGSRKELYAALRIARSIQVQFTFEVKNLWYGKYNENTTSWQELERLTIDQ